MAAALGTVRGQIVIDTAQAKAQLEGFNRTVQTTTQKGASGFRALTGAVKTMTPILAAAGAAATVALGVKAVKATSEFRSQLNQAATVAGATTAEMEQMQATALRLGKDTSFSAYQASTAFLELARSGFSASQSIEGVDAVVQLAAAATTDMGTAAEISSDLMTSFGLQASDLESIVNSMAGATLNSAQNFEDLIYSTRYAAPAFANMGWTMEDLATSTAALASAGIKGSQAGTSLRSMFSRLIKPSEEASETMAVLGINIENSDGSFKSFEETVAHVNDKLSNMKGVDRQRVMIELFGLRAMNAASILFNHTGPEIEALGDTVNASGQATKAAAATMEGLGGALLYFKGTVESTMIAAIIPLEDHINNLIRGTADLISEWGAKFSTAATNVNNWVTSIAARYKELLEALPLDAQNTEGTLFGWIQEQVAVFELWLEGWDAAAAGSDLAQKMANVIGTTIGNVAQWSLTLGQGLIDGVIGGINLLSQWISGGSRDQAVDDAIANDPLNLTGTILDTDSISESTLSSTLSAIWRTFKEEFKATWEANKPGFEGQWEAIKTEWSTLILNAVAGIGTAVTEGDALGGITTNLNNFADDLTPENAVAKLSAWGTGIQGWFTGIKDSLTLWWDGVKLSWNTSVRTWDLSTTGLDTKWETFKTALTNTFTGLGETIQGVWDAAVQMASDNAGAWGTSLGDVYGKAWGTVTAWWSGHMIEGGLAIFRGLKFAVNAALALFTGFMNLAAADGGTLLTAFGDFAKNAWTGFTTAFSNAWDESGLESQWTDLQNEIEDGVKGAWTDAVTTWETNKVAWGKAMGKGIGNAVGEAWGFLATQVTGWGTTLFTHISTAVQNAAENLASWMSGGQAQGETEQAGQSFATVFWENLVTSFNTSWSAYRSTFQQNLTALKDVLAALWESLTYAWDTLRTGWIADLGERVRGVISGAIDWVTTNLSVVSTSLKAWLGAMWEQLVQAWNEQKTAWGDTLGTMFGALLGNAFGWIATNAVSLAEGVVTGLTSVMTNALVGFSAWLSGSGQGDTEEATEGFGKAFWTALNESIVQAWTDAKPRMVEAFGSLKEAVSEAISEIPAAAQQAWSALGTWWLGTDEQAGMSQTIGESLATMWDDAVTWFVDNDEATGVTAARVLAAIASHFNPISVALKFAEIGSEVATGLINALTEWLRSSEDDERLTTATDNFGNAFWDTFSSSVNAAWERKLESLRESFGGLGEAFRGLIAELFQWQDDDAVGDDAVPSGVGEIIWTSIKNNIRSAWESKVDEWTAPFKLLGAWIKTWNPMALGEGESINVGQLIWEGIATDLETWWNRTKTRIENAISSVESAIPEWIRNLFGGQSTTTTISITWPELPTFTWPELPLGLTGWKWPDLSTGFNGTVSLTSWKWPDLSSGFLGSTSLTGWKWPDLSTGFLGSTSLTGWKWPDLSTGFTGTVSLTGWQWPDLSSGYTGTTSLIAWAWPDLSSQYTGSTSLISWKWPDLANKFTGAVSLTSWKWPDLSSQYTGSVSLTGWVWPTLPIDFTGWQWPGIPDWLANFRWPSINLPGWAQRLFDIEDDRDRDRDRDRRDVDFGSMRQSGEPNRQYPAWQFWRNALGTPNSPGGWSWVGERGPELMRLPTGTEIQSAPQSAFTARGGGDTDPVQVTIVTNDGEDSVTAWLAYREYQFAG